MVAESLAASDLAVGAVLVTGLRAPKVITKEMIAGMEPGSVFVDVAIDQGGCAETSRPTTHDAPVYTKYGVTHYCVTNMPALVSQTSTYALSNAILPYVVLAADGRVDDTPALRKGINIDAGELKIALS